MVCHCRCHGSSAVDGADVIEAAVACPACENRHCEALLRTELPCESPFAGRGVTVITPEGRRMTWADYQREMERRAEAWREGEGDEC